MPETLTDLSNALAGLVERHAPSIVRIEARRRGPSSGVVWAADGLVVTAQHVIEHEDGIEVGLPDGRTVEAVLVGRDPATDVAVLRVPASGLAAAAWSETNGLRVGQLVLAVSRPGRSARAGLGMLSALGEGWRSPAGGRLDRYVQTDLAIHIGFSGSLLVDAAGSAVGMNTTGLLRSQALAIPGPTLRRVVASLLSHGRIRRGFLGIGTYPARLPEHLQKSLGQPSALLLVSVEADSPAARAGLVQGDVLVALAGQPVRHPGELLELLEEDSIGHELPARIVRAGELREVTVAVGVRS